MKKTEDKVSVKMYVSISRILSENTIDVIFKQIIIVYDKCLKINLSSRAIGTRRHCDGTVYMLVWSDKVIEPIVIVNIGSRSQIFFIILIIYWHVFFNAF